MLSSLGPEEQFRRDFKVIISILMTFFQGQNKKLTGINDC